MLQQYFCITPIRTPSHGLVEANSSKFGTMVNAVVCEARLAQW